MIFCRNKKNAACGFEDLLSNRRSVSDSPQDERRRKSENDAVLIPSSLIASPFNEEAMKNANCLMFSLVGFSHLRLLIISPVEKGHDSSFASKSKCHRLMKTRLLGFTSLASSC